MKRPAEAALAAWMVLVLVTGQAIAAGSSVDGVQGLLRMHSADTGTPGYVSGSVYGLYSVHDFPPAVNPRGTWERFHFGASVMSLGFTPNRYVELSLRGTVESQYAWAGESQSESQIGTGDVTVNVKTLLTPAEEETWKLGAELFLGTTTEDQGALLGSWDSDGLDLGGQLNLTYAYRRRENYDPSLKVHLNAGYLNRTTEFDQAAWQADAAGGMIPRSVRHGDQFLYGAAIELPAPNNWTFFTEWTGEYDVEADVPFGDNPMRVTPGFRYGKANGSLVWTTGYEVTVSSENSAPGWQLVSGITFGGYSGPVDGSILGFVRDAETGTPIPGVEVAVRNSDGMPAVTDGKGKFSTEIPEGYVVLELSADGYNPKTRVVEVKGNDTVEFDFTMTKRNIYGSIRGRVRDEETGEPIFARVRLAGSPEWIETDPSSGSYLLEKVPEGTVEIEVEARSFVSGTAQARVFAGDVAAVDVSLPRDANARMGVLSGYVRDKNTGEIVAATVTARGKRTMTTTADPETGLFELELEEGTYNISVTSPGYIARVEPIPITAKAAAVRNFDLEVLPRKMTLKGIYFDSGAATIKRESFAALEEAAKFLSENDHLRVVIEGHTDSKGSLAGNLALSQRRADAVMKFLVVNYGVDPKRLIAKGVGPHEPIASNETREGRALNRRIQFLLDQMER